MKSFHLVASKYCHHRLLSPISLMVMMSSELAMSPQSSLIQEVR